ncbi:hypothetical protein VUR80DRAFT_3391 [Thermomyces stellatus]
MTACLWRFPPSHETGLGLHSACLPGRRSLRHPVRPHTARRGPCHLENRTISGLILSLNAGTIGEPPSHGGHVRLSNMTCAAPCQFNLYEQPWPRRECPRRWVSVLDLENKGIPGVYVGGVTWEAWPRPWITAGGLATLFGITPLRRLHCPTDHVAHHSPLSPLLRPALLLFAFEAV